MASDDDDTSYIDVAARLDERSADEVEHRLRDKLALLDKLRSASAHGRRGSLAVAREMTNELAKG